MGISIVLGLLIALFTSILLWVLVACRWTNCKRIFHNAYTPVDILFIFLYFFEQLSLIILLKDAEYSPELTVGIFSLIVVTTAALQNRAWESRLSKIKSRVIEQDVMISRVVDENRKIMKDNVSLSNTLDKSKQFINKIYGELENEILKARKTTKSKKLG